MTERRGRSNIKIHNASISSIKVQLKPLPLTKSPSNVEDIMPSPFPVN